MRIYYLSQSLIPSTLADSIQVMKMCAAFAGGGHDVTLFATHAPGVSDDIFSYYGVVESFLVRFDYPEPERKKKPYFGSRYRWTLGKEFRQNPPDLFYGRDIGRLLAAAAGGRPVICEVHDLPAQKGRFQRLIDHPALARIVAITEALKADLIASYPGLPPDKIVVSPDGADPPPAGLRPAPLRSSRPGQLNVGYTGNLYPGKGMEILSRMPARCGWADFHVVGGTDEDVARWQRELGSTANLFFYGNQEPHRVAGYIAAADVVLAPYQRSVSAHAGAQIGRWMSPLKVFEYMALAKPIIASDVPVLCEVLQDGVTAILVPPDDIDAWVGALRSLARDSDRCAALGSQARAAFDARFTWATRSRAVLDSFSVPTKQPDRFWSRLFRAGSRHVYNVPDHR
jgi:glycosyltransferase involved in cell wall biosynthesis